MEEKIITVVDEQGEEIKCEVLFTFDSEEYNKSYVLYYPLEGEDEDGTELFASSFDPDSTDGGDLKPITSDEEWDMIEEVLNTFLEEENE